MNSEIFMQEVEEGHKRSVELLLKKEPEYSNPDGNRLSQFYRIGTLKEESPAESLITLAAKHFTSICDMARDPVAHSMEQWDEKITDLRNYTHLLDALVRDIFKASGVPRMEVKAR